MRNKRLDILRCIAVFLVMLNHGGVWPAVAHNGWVGVDLFFVLSGFLISGLLFSEYKARNSINFKRFFIRRGLKIYPAFYVFLVLTGALYYVVFHSVSSVPQYLAEVFFVQNYWHGVWITLGHLAWKSIFTSCCQRCCSSWQNDPRPGQIRSLLCHGYLPPSRYCVSHFALLPSVLERRTITLPTLLRTIESTLFSLERFSVISIISAAKAWIAYCTRRGIAR